MTLTAPARVSTWRRVSWAHPELPLAAVAGAAWIGVLALHSAMTSAAHSHHTVAHPAPGFIVSVAVWILMSTAMMLPTALPPARSIALNGTWSRRQRGPALFALGYLAVWAVVGVALFGAIQVIGLEPGSPRLLGTALALAAIWELTHRKRWYLRGCHRLRSLPPSGWKADCGCLGLGVRNGLTCAGACWAMMLPMALAGHTAGMWLMLLLFGAIGAEKLLRDGVHYIPWVAAGLAVSAVTVVL